MNKGECFSIKETKGMSFLMLGKINRGTEQNEGQINMISNSIKNSADRTLTSPAAKIQMRHGDIYNEGANSQNQGVCMNKERSQSHLSDFFYLFFFFFDL